mgnify:CR=1 FL=1
MKRDDNVPCLDSSSPPSRCTETSSTSEILGNELKIFPNGFQVAHVNAQSILKHFDEFFAIFSPHSLHALLVSESWMKPSLPSSLVSLQGYTLFRNDRIGKGAGGVAVFVRNDIKVKTLSQSPGPYSASAEFLILELTTQFKTLLLACVYRAPNLNFDNFEDAISQFIPLYNDILILGDVNYDVMTTKPEVMRFRETIESLNLCICPLDPTHKTEKSESWIDHIMVNDITKVLCTGQTPVPGISRHDLIYLIYDISVPKYTPRVIKRRSLKCINEKALKMDVNLLPWYIVYSEPRLDAKIAVFNSFIHCLYNKHAPIKVKRVRRPQNPWINDQILALMKQRDNAHRRYRTALKRNDSSVDPYREEYRKLRNRCNQTVRKAKSDFASKLVNDTSQPRELWRKLKLLGVGTKRNNFALPDLPLNILNEEFCYTSSLSYEDKINTIDSFERLAKLNNTFNFHLITETEVTNAVNRIKSQASGRDDIPIVLIKMILPDIIDVIIHIFNFSLSTGEFPSLWKYADVRPIPKTSNPVSSEELRPISILPALSKALEHIVRSQLTKFLSSNNILNPFQSGFRSQYGTNTALINITEDIRSAMDNRHITMLALLDFSKAFQTVDVDILLAKLTSVCNVSPIVRSWFASYLTDRQQRVVVEDNHSPWKRVTCGVPQGSVLGPLLFSLYINDLPQRITFSKYHMYADDVQCYISSPTKDIAKVYSNLSTDIKAICTWSSKNGLKINAMKSKFIIIGSRKILSSFDYSDIPGLLVDGTMVPLSDNVTNLGLAINKHLSWNDHINNICKKAYGSLHSLYRLKHFLPEPVKASLVQTLVISHLDYCDTVYIDLTEVQSKRIQRIQNACVRFVHNARRYDHLTDYYRQLRWAKMHARRQLHVLMLLWKIIKYKQPTYLYDRFKFLSESHTFNTRSKERSTLVIHPHKSDFLAKSFTLTASRAWNSIPCDIKNSPSLTIFKRKLKEYLSSAIDYVQ